MNMVMKLSKNTMRTDEVDATSPVLSITARQNRLLHAMQPEDFNNLLPYLQLVSISRDKQLDISASALTHVYFPISGFFSLVTSLENGKSTQISVIGNEGMVGISAFMGECVIPSTVISLSDGHVLRLDKDLFKRYFECSESLRQILLRYLVARMTDISQTVACTRYHSLEQQFCRWLLSGLDRTQSGEFVTTHEAIANILGVRRETVTSVAGKLEEDGLIQYSRKHIRIIDQCALESRACECYKVIKGQYDAVPPMLDKVMHAKKAVPHITYGINTVDTFV
ncbi:MAG: Crp/Fnr family transcriptional regulator [Gammaproteobacteria bacterium]